MNYSSNCSTFLLAGAFSKMIWAFNRFVQETSHWKNSDTQFWHHTIPISLIFRQDLKIYTSTINNWDISYLLEPLNPVNWSSALYNIKSCSLFTYFFISAQIGHGTRGARAKIKQLRKCVDFVTPCYTFYCTKHNKAKTWLSRLDLWKKLFFLSCSQFVVCQTLTPRLKAAFNWLINRWRSCVKIVRF